VKGPGGFSQPEIRVWRCSFPHRDREYIRDFTTPQITSNKASYSSTNAGAASGHAAGHQFSFEFLGIDGSSSGRAFKTGVEAHDLIALVNQSQNKEEK
jgi:hypothetical protein